MLIYSLDLSLQEVDANGLFIVPSVDALAVPLDHRTLSDTWKNVKSRDSVLCCALWPTPFNLSHLISLVRETRRKRRSISHLRFRRSPLLVRFLIPLLALLQCSRLSPSSVYLSTYLPNCLDSDWLPRKCFRSSYSSALQTETPRGNSSSLSSTQFRWENDFHVFFNFCSVSDGNRMMIFTTPIVADCCFYCHLGCCCWSSFSRFRSLSIESRLTLSYLEIEIKKTKMRSIKWRSLGISPFLLHINCTETGRHYQKINADKRAEREAQLRKWQST